MKYVFLEKTKFSLILLGVTALLFLAHSLYGILDFIGYGNYYSWSSALIGYIFVPIIAFLILLQAIVYLIAHVLKEKTASYKLLVALVYFLIFGLTMALIVNIIMYSYTGFIMPNGPIIMVLLSVAAVFAFACSVFQIYLFAKAPNKTKKSIKEAKDNAIEELRILRALFEEKLISEEEYNEKKKEKINLL